MVNSSFRSILVIILLISSMFIGLIGFENEIVGNSSADVFYVYPTGNVTGNYSKIQHAIDNATAGDTIYVWSGTYSENVIINKSITLIGNGTEATIIQANLSSSHAVHINVSNVNLRGFTASGASGALKAGVFMTDSMNSKLENINASNNYIGIYLTFSDNNLIANCTTNDNSNGIYLFDGCDNNTLVNISSNSNSMGIGIETNSHNNTLIDSTVTENSNYGITLGNSGKLTLKNNNVGPNSNYGIYVYNCQNCEIFENNVSSNAKGIYLQSSDDNLVYHNNIDSNSVQGWDNSANYWNATYPIGGNYWSDYSGIDNFTGPGKNLSGMDNLGDTNYTNIGGGGGNLDVYPLMYEFVWWTAIDPVINLISPANNSLFERGVILKFDIYDKNYDIETVNYRVNGGFNRTFNTNYEINTSGFTFWWDNLYIIEISAEDFSGRITTQEFYFNIDSNAPNIWLTSPLNNSGVKTGTDIDFTISDMNLNIVTYSVNGVPHTTFAPPYNVTTDTWTDGDYFVEVYAIDTLGHYRTRIYNFTVDTTDPVITLMSPANNSVITPGTFIFLNVLDTNLVSVNYSWDGAPKTDKNAPYDLSTNSFMDGVHWVEIIAADSAGNIEVANYTFIIDSVDPEIDLISPANNAFIKAGVTIDLTATDENLDYVNYTINGGGNQTLPYPYDLNTSSWADGKYAIYVYAHDLAGHITAATYTITVDTTSPDIQLVSPSDGFIKPAGIDIILNISDAYLFNANYTVNAQITIDLSSPFVISTTGWSDRDYTIEVRAIDKAGNINNLSFDFTLDSTRPVIVLNSPAVNSEIIPGTLIDMDVTDLHLISVNYSINNGEILAFTAPYDLNTTDWPDGEYEITVNAIDTADNTASRTLKFTVKEIVIIIAPEVVSTIPEDKDDEVAIDTDIVIEFSLAMDRTSVEGAISFSPDVTVASFTWNSNSTIVTLMLSDDLDYNTEYTVTVKTDAADALNVPLGSAYIFSFTTKMDTDKDGLPDDIDEDDDGDGMADLWEDANTLDSLDPTDADEDEDSDELTNYEEYLNNTDPKDPDSDDDGLTDGAEVKTHDTKPKIADSDDDGYSDGDEITEGTDPNDPNSNLDVKEPKEDESDGSMLMLLILLVIIVVMVLVIMFFMMKRKKKDEEPVEGEEGEEEDKEVIYEDFDCPQCGAIVPGGELNCPECGAEFVPEEGAEDTEGSEDTEVAEGAEDDLYGEEAAEEAEAGAEDAEDADDSEYAEASAEEAKEADEELNGEESEAETEAEAEAETEAEAEEFEDDDEELGEEIEEEDEEEI